MKYVVYLKDWQRGATSGVDLIEAPENYTAEDYIRDCKKNADPEWIEMLETGEVTVYCVEGE